jgi:hypothetical protein
MIHDWLLSLSRRSRRRWKSQPISIAIRDKKDKPTTTTISGEVSVPWAVHPSYKREGWTVTHLPTGLLVTDCLPSRDIAVGAVLIFQKLIPDIGKIADASDVDDIVPLPRRLRARRIIDAIEKEWKLLHNNQAPFKVQRKKKKK